VIFKSFETTLAMWTDRHGANRKLHENQFVAQMISSKVNKTCSYRNSKWNQILIEILW